MKVCASCNNTFDDTQSFCPHDGEVLQETAESIVGQVLEGKYKVESFIAQGGMGAVYRARHILLGDDVVIKTLRSEMRNNSEWLKRFQREGKAARAFRHPNSVTVYDLSAGSDGLIYMVMEYVEGHTLDRELKLKGRFRPEEALEVLEPVADVLDAAHARGVVHRDLKPENIMLGKADDGHEVVKVLDLGIAKMVGAGDVHAAEATSLTMAGQILGTPYYMSPEQWGEMPRDGRAEVDGRTDIYSLGVIFFELIAGRKPLGGSTLSELRHKHVSEPLPSLSELAPDVPAAFSRAVARAVEKDRNDRPPSAGELVEEMRAALGMPARARVARTVAYDNETRAGEGRSAIKGERSPAGGEAATAHLQPDPWTGQPLDVSHAETIVTSGQTAAAPDRFARETSPQGTDAGRFGRGGRATVTSHALHTGTAATDELRSAGHTGTEATREAARTDSAPALERKSTFMPLILGGALALVLLAGIGGWLAFRGGGGKASEAPSNSVAPPAPAVAPKTEAVSYWLEAFDGSNAEVGRAIAETSATLTSGQRFRFHFKPRERGYLYIIGPGAGGNALMTILTGQGGGQLKSNLVSGDADFEFPFGGARLKLDDNKGAEEFTVIFSPTPLLAPSFLAGEYLHELTPAEVKELEDLRAQSRGSAGPPALEVLGEGAARRVAVSVPESAKGQPVVFDIRINHQ